MGTLQSAPAMIEVTQALEGDSVDGAAELFREYQREIGVDLCFQNFEQELQSLPGEYAPPTGRLLVAMCGSELAGCVALRRLSESICEMKRLYVRPRFKGRGIGRQLATAIVEQAREVGYQAMRLDTLATMTEASALYCSLGFKPIAPYRYNPLPGTLFFEKAL